MEGFCKPADDLDVHQSEFEGKNSGGSAGVTDTENLTLGDLFGLPDEVCPAALQVSVYHMLLARNILCIRRV